MKTSSVRRILYQTLQVKICFVFPAILWGSFLEKQTNALTADGQEMCFASFLFQLHYAPWRRIPEPTVCVRFCSSVH